MHIISAKDRAEYLCKYDQHCKDYKGFINGQMQSYCALHGLKHNMPSESWRSISTNLVAFYCTMPNTTCTFFYLQSLIYNRCCICLNGKRWYFYDGLQNDGQLVHQPNMKKSDASRQIAAAIYTLPFSEMDVKCKIPTLTSASESPTSSTTSTKPVTWLDVNAMYSSTQ